MNENRRNEITYTRMRKNYCESTARQLTVSIWLFILKLFFKKKTRKQKKTRVCDLSLISPLAKTYKKYLNPTEKFILSVKCFFFFNIFFCSCHNDWCMRKITKTVHTYAGDNHIIYIKNMIQETWLLL